MKAIRKTVVVVLLSWGLPAPVLSAQTFGTNPKPHLVYSPELFMAFAMVFSFLP